MRGRELFGSSKDGLLIIALLSLLLSSALFRQLPGIAFADGTSDSERRLWVSLAMTTNVFDVPVIPISAVVKDLDGDGVSEIADPFRS